MLSAAPPLEPPQYAVGRRTVTLTDAGRDHRILIIDIWYPATLAGEALTQYEPLPGIVFESALAHDQPAMHVSEDAGRYPLVLLSHGRTGMRFAYSLLCETIAARGYIVVAADHPGDALMDWLGGTFVDDATNEIGRVGDSSFLLDMLLGGSTGHQTSDLPADLLDAIDPQRVAAIGHSYGAYTGLAATAGARGVVAEHRIKAVIGVQPFTRTMADDELSRVNTPTLLVISELDQTTPAERDGDRPWQLISASPSWRLDLGGAAHHASSDMGLYLEFAATLPNLPAMVTAYVSMMTGEMTGERYRPWRERMELEIRAIAAFLDIVLDIDPERGEAEAERVASAQRVRLQRR